MAYPPDRVVPFRVARDKDDEDSSAATTLRVKLPKPPRPETASASLSTISPSYTGTPYPTADSVEAYPSSGRHFGPAESAGIGVGVGIAVLIVALGAWFFARRRWLSRTRKSSVSSAADTEAGSKAMDVGFKGYGPPGIKELEAGRRASELAAHMDPVEVVGDPEFVAELQGSDKPVPGWRKPDRERLFPDSPIDEPDDHDELGFSKMDIKTREPDDHKESDLSTTDSKKHYS